MNLLLSPYSFVNGESAALRPEYKPSSLLIRSLAGLAFGLALAVMSALAIAAPAMRVVDVRFSGGVEEPVVNPTPPTHTRITWTDSAGRERSALLARNTNGAMTEFYYHRPDNSRRTAGTTPGNGNGGFGYPISHDDQNRVPSANNPQFTPVFIGRHQAIFRYTMTYPRFPKGGDAPQYNVPVTIEWMFSTGHDHPLYSITWDLSDVPVNAISADVRTPYGELNFSSSNATISGVEWGDRYKFTTTSSPLTYESAWTWNVPNRVPYVALWATATDATMGLVQTQSLDHHDAGAWNPNWKNVAADCWNKTSETAPVCRDADRGIMPWQNNWPYQAVSWNWDFDNPNPALRASPSDTTNVPRLTWGMSEGALGQANYSTHDSALNVVQASGWPRQSYSLAVILGTHSSNPVAAEVARTEALESVELSAGVGRVALSGLAGNVPLNKQTNISDNLLTYSPAGYDPVRGSLTFIADNDQRLTATIKSTAAITQPLIVVRHMRGVPASITLNGVPLTVDVDYFASFRADTNEAWITLAGSLAAGEHTLELYAMPQFRGTNISGMENTGVNAPDANTNYPVWNTRLIDYFKSKGLTTIRFIVQWESLQPNLLAPIPYTATAANLAYFKNYKRIVDYATNVAGMQVIIDLRGGNDGTRANYRNVSIGLPAVPITAFADVWGKIATIFKGNALVSYGLINEPNNQSTMTLFEASQAAINAIRATGSKQRIFVSGNGWTGASHWNVRDVDAWYDRDNSNPLLQSDPPRSNAYGWLNANGPGNPLFDPLNNIVIEVHMYLDSDGSGSTDGITSRTAARAGIANTLDWAKANGLKVFLGEIGLCASFPNGGASSFTGSEAWMDFVNYFNDKDNADTFIGYTWWAAGNPGWWDDPCATNGGHFSITPTNNYTGDTINMRMLQKDF
jgi:hypothetical protein